MLKHWTIFRIRAVVIEDEKKERFRLRDEISAVAIPAFHALKCRVS